MSIAAFIKDNLEPILADWENFAATQQPAAKYLDSVALRDYAGEMLLRIADDMLTENRERQVTVSAHDHAAHRLSSAFSQEQLVAEFRSLRASVIRRWTSGMPEFGPTEIADLIRFNEAVDQLLTESLVWYGRMLQETQKRLNEVTAQGAQKYHVLADVNPDAVLINVGGKIAYANPAAARLLGAHSPDEIVGRPVLDVFDPECRDIVREHIRLVFAGQTIPLIELQWQGLDGSPLQVEVAAGPVPWNGGMAMQIIARQTPGRR